MEQTKSYAYPYEYDNCLFCGNYLDGGSKFQCPIPDTDMVEFCSTLCFNAFLDDVHEFLKNVNYSDLQKSELVTTL